MKNNKRKFSLIKLCFTLFSISAVLAVCSAIFLKSYNVDLNNQVKEKEKQIVQLQSEVDTITLQVNELTDYNRVLDIIGESISSVDSQITSLTY